MTESYKDVHEFLSFKLKELKTIGDTVISTNNNKNTLKESLIELPHQFFCIENQDKCVFNLNSFRTQPWWLVGEILTEFLGINPPVMSKYRPDLVEMNYKLTPQGTCEYLYGTRWNEHNQLENIRKKLEKNPMTKKAIIQTWMPYDSSDDRSDSPCNINYMFLYRNNKLDMTATIRSNDIMRGAKYDYALASFMQQSIASWVGLDVGKLYFHINSLHIYNKDLSNLEGILEELDTTKKTAISLKLPQHIDSITYWKDIRHVKKAEEASYNASWDYCYKNVDDISTPLFRDFARIFAIKNAQHLKNNDEKYMYLKDIESDEISQWLT